MKKRYKKPISAVAFVGILLFFNVGCEKKDIGEAPTVATVEISDITETTAISGGEITAEGSSEITARGICWAAGREPTISDSKTDEGAGNGSFTGNLTSLVKNTTYYVRAYATNSDGTGYGSSLSFTTLQGSGSVTDVDGNIYDTVAIGTQVWMVQNLRVTHYRNGDPIDNLDDNTEWCNSITGAYCDYGNDVNNVPVYGRLYNWYAVNDSRNIAPVGWHVASDAEWTTLINYLGGESVAGAKLKEAGTTHWTSPNSGAVDAVGFAALPGGSRFGQYGIPGYGTFTKIGKTAEWWTSDEQCSRGTGYDVTEITHSIDSRQSDGFSVRCVKD